jgi:hypothetical protein
MCMSLVEFWELFFPNVGKYIPDYTVSRVAIIADHRCEDLRSHAMC